MGGRGRLGSGIWDGGGCGLRGGRELGSGCRLGGDRRSSGGGGLGGGGRGVFEQGEAFSIFGNRVVELTQFHEAEVAECPGGCAYGQDCDNQEYLEEIEIGRKGEVGQSGTLGEP